MYNLAIITVGWNVFDKYVCVLVLLCHLNFNMQLRNLTGQITIKFLFSSGKL